MWAFIRWIIGACIALMIISYLLRGVMLPVVLVPDAVAADAPIESSDEIARALEDIAGPEDVTNAPASSPMAAAVPAAAEDSTTSAAAPAVESETLAPEPIDAAALASRGVLTAQNGGFDTAVWAGVPRAQAELMLGRLRNTGLKSPSGRRMLQRLLLTTATPPAGQSSANWLATRVRTLQALGLADAARALLEGVTEKDLLDDDLAQAWVGSKLLEGQRERACAFVQQYILNTDAPFWRHAMLACQALDKDNVDKFKLALDLVSGAERRADPLLFGLFDAIKTGGNGPMLAPGDRFSALDAALYAAYPQLLNPEVITRLPDLTLRQIMENAELPLSTRLQAAEKLVNDYGSARDVAVLAQLYETAKFSTATLEAPLKFVQEQADGSLARALLWQAAGAAKLASGKALVLKMLWQRAEKDNLPDLPGSLTPSLRDIEPETNLAWFSPYVIKTALRSGNLPVAQAWWRVLSSNRSLSRDLTVERTDLAVAFAMLNGALPGSVLDHWWSTQTLNSTQSQLKALRTLALLDALDLPVPADMWISLHQEFDDAYIERGRGPGPMWLRLVGSSIEKGNTGEAVLLLLEPEMYAHPVAMAPQGVANIVAGLRFLGLKDDATSLALEAMLQTEQAGY